MQEIVTTFFRSYELACVEDDTASAASAFAENFFYSDGTTARMLPRAAILAASAQRRAAMEQAGFGSSRLQQIDVFPLDAHYAWAATVWSSATNAECVERQPLVLRATYLVEVREADVRIVAYLSHTNFAEALAKSEEKSEVS
jgi:hypothetical protein